MCRTGDCEKTDKKNAFYFYLRLTCNCAQPHLVTMATIPVKERRKKSLYALWYGYETALQKAAAATAATNQEQCPNGTHEGNRATEWQLIGVAFGIIYIRLISQHFLCILLVIFFFSIRSFSFRGCCTQHTHTQYIWYQCRTKSKLRNGIRTNECLQIELWSLAADSGSSTISCQF